MKSGSHSIARSSDSTRKPPPSTLVGATTRISRICSPTSADMSPLRPCVRDHVDYEVSGRVRDGAAARADDDGRLALLDDRGPGERLPGFDEVAVVNGA